MAKVLSKTGVRTGQTIQAFHISQSVDAFTGLSAYNITISGGLTVNGYSFPSQDGLAQQTLATDGSGNLTFQTLPLAVSASYVTSSGVDGPLGFDSITTASYAVSASHVEFADLASASYHAVNASDANTATSASYARTASVVTDSNVAFLDQSNTFTGQTQTFTDIVVNGTGSFSVIQSVTGSAKIIGDAFIQLNENTPSQRYAGIQVVDSGSTFSTASFFFDGLENNWMYEYEGDDTEYALALFGPEFGTKGSPVSLTENTVPLATGSHHLVDSNITDDGSTITLGSNTSITGTVVATGTTLVSGSAQVTSLLPSGGVSGSAQTIANLPAGTVSGSAQIDLGSATGTAANATSASFSTTASFALNAGGGLSAQTASTSLTMSANIAYVVTGTAAPITMSLPSSPNVGELIKFANMDDRATLLGRNGNNIMGLAEDMTLNVEQVSFDLVYVGPTAGWTIYGSRALS